MYKLPEMILTSTVYKGWKISVGWKEIRKFLERMKRDGYTLIRLHYSYNTPQYGYVVCGTYKKDGELKRIETVWEDAGDLNLLRSKMVFKSMEEV